MAQHYGEEVLVPPLGVCFRPNVLDAGECEDCKYFEGCTNVNKGRKAGAARKRNKKREPEQVPVPVPEPVVEKPKPKPKPKPKGKKPGGLFGKTKKGR